MCSRSRRSRRRRRRSLIARQPSPVVPSLLLHLQLHQPQPSTILQQMQMPKKSEKTWRTCSSTIAMGTIFFHADSQLRICIRFYFSRIPLKAFKCLSAAGAHSMRGERRGQTGTEGRHVNKTFLGWPLMRQSLLQSESGEAF